MGSGVSLALGDLEVHALDVVVVAQEDHVRAGAAAHVEHVADGALGLPLEDFAQGARLGLVVLPRVNSVVNFG